MCVYRQCIIHTIAGMLVVSKVVADFASAHVASRPVHTDLVTTAVVSEALINVCKWGQGSTNTITAAYKIMQ